MAARTDLPTLTEVIDLQDSMPGAYDPTAPMPMVAKSSLSATMMKAPLSFEANHGQTDSRVEFLARGSGYAVPDR